MRIIQTFWSQDKNLLENSFGWLHPEYHIMAWALSCLRIKEFYKDLTLYTDTNTYKLFNKLNLPYSSIIKCYDNLEYNQNIWAIPKILTYQKQNLPFLHIDGDVFIGKQFRLELIKSELITQNSEIPTQYYNSKISHCFKDLQFIPKVLEEVFFNKDISSFNAGIFGGKNLEFIQDFCNQSLTFIEENNLQKKNIDVFFNVIFEQILFAKLAKANKKEVSCLINEPVEDYGYSFDKFCDFNNNSKFVHIIGNYKKDKHICNMLYQTMSNEYPEYLNKIVSLFSQNRIVLLNSLRNINLVDEIDKQAFLKTYRIYKSSESYQALEFKKSKIEEIKDESSPLLQIYRYERAVNNYLNSKVSCLKNNQVLFNSNIINSKKFLTDTKLDHHYKLRLNPFLKIIEESIHFTDETRLLMQNILGEKVEENNGIVCVLDNTINLYQEVVIDQLNYIILSKLKENERLTFLLKELEKFFTLDNYNERISFYKLIHLKLKYLIYNKCLEAIPLEYE